MLRAIFTYLASPGLIDPHEGCEIDLLLNGRKPIGLFCYVDGEQRNNLTLEQACREGKLLKREHRFFARHLDQYLTAFFYSQLNHQHELDEIFNSHVQLWETGEGAALSGGDPGIYFGYSQADISLWKSGGYASRSTLKGQIQRRTHALRQYCRHQLLLDPRPPPPQVLG